MRTLGLLLVALGCGGLISSVIQINHQSLLYQMSANVDTHNTLIIPTLEILAILVGFALFAVQRRSV